MKTEYVPAMVTLSAGMITCILGFKNHLAMYDFVKQLLLVLIIFYVIGCIVQIILKKAMKALSDKEEPIHVPDEEAQPLENINSTEEY